MIVKGFYAKISIEPVSHIRQRPIFPFHVQPITRGLEAYVAAHILRIAQMNNPDISSVQ